MSYIANHVATVPKGNFAWYLIFLECPFTDAVQKEIDEHFVTLGREVGRDILVVRGFDPTTFRQSVFEAPAFKDEKWRDRARFPSLMVTNRAPSEAVTNNKILDKGKVMIFPLAEIYGERKSLAAFLSDLVQALKSEDAMSALDSVDGSRLEKGWGWLSKYVKMEPGFFGFSLKLNEAMKDVLAH
jgi:hypothetical protein